MFSPAPLLIGSFVTCKIVALVQLSRCDSTSKAKQLSDDDFYIFARRPSLSRSFCSFCALVSLMKPLDLSLLLSNHGSRYCVLRAA